MKNLNLRLVIILAVCVIVFVGGVVPFHGWQNRSNSGFFYRQAELSEERAEKAEKEGDKETAQKAKEKAIKQLNWYLNLKPDDVDAQEKMGLLMADLALDPDVKMGARNMFSPAWIKLSNVVDQDPDRTTARRRLVDLAMRVGGRRYKDAREHIEFLLKASSKDAELWDLLGQCQQGVREYRKAADSYRDAVESDPAQLDTYQHLARLLRYRLRDPDKADEWMEKLVTANPESASAHLLHGDYLTEIGLLQKAMQQALKGRVLMIAATEHALKGRKMSNAMEQAPKVRERTGKAIRKAREELGQNKAMKEVLNELEDTIKAMEQAHKEWEHTIGAMEQARKELWRNKAIKQSLSQLDLTMKAMKSARDKWDQWNEDIRKRCERSGTKESLKEALTRLAKEVRKGMEPASDGMDVALEELKEPWENARKGLLLAAQCASAKIREDGTPGERGLGDLVPGIEATLELSEDGQTVSRIMIGPMKENGEGDGEEETPQDQPKPTTITGKIVAADAEANTITLIRDSDAGEPKEETLAVSPEVEFASNYADLARRYAKRGIELFPDNVQMYITLSNIELRSGNRDKAIVVSDDGLKATKDNPQLIWGKADIQIDIGDLGFRDAVKGSPEYYIGARGTIRRLRKLPPRKKYPEPLIGYLEARIEFAESRWAEAARRFESIRGGLVRLTSYVIRTDFHLAHCYAQLRNPDRQRSVLRRILIADPFNALALDLLAKSYMQAGRVNDALKVYEQLSRLGRIPENSQLAVVRMMARRNVRQPPSERNWKPVDEMLDRALGKFPQGAPKPSEIVILKAESLRAQDREQEAIDLLQQERDKDPRKPRYWSALSAFAMQNNPPKWLETEQLLDNGDKAVPGYSVILRLSRVSYLVSRHGSGAAEQLAALTKEGEEHFAAELAKNKKDIEKNNQEIDKIKKQLKGLSGDEERDLEREKTALEARGSGLEREKRALEVRRSELENERLWLLRGMLSATVQIGAVEPAKKLYVRVSTLAPHDVSVRFEHFDLALRSRESNDVLRNLSEKVGQVEGKGPYWLFTQAVLLSMPVERSDDKRLVKALALIKQIRELRPSWSRPVILAAGIYEKQNKPDLALKRYLTAIEDMGARHSSAIGRAVQLLNRRNEQDKAQELINLLGERVAYLPAGLRKSAERTMISQGDIDRALALAEQEAANSKDPSDHVWLGQLQATKLQKDQSKLDPMQTAKLLNDSEQSFRKAVELDPKNANSWVGLIYFLSATGQAEKAGLATAEAKTQIPANRASLALARCRDRMNQFDQARPLYEAAYATSPDDPVVARFVADFLLRVPSSPSKNALSADKILKRMIDGKVKGGKEDVRWARQRMSTLLGTRGGYQGLKRALKLVEENLAELPSSVSDLRLKSKLLAGYPQRAYRQQAIEILEKLARGEQSPPDDQFVLAKLYLSEDAWGKASRQFRSLIATLSAKGGYRRSFQSQCVAAYLEALISHNEFGTARSYLTQFKELAPNTYVAVDLEARLLAQKGEFNEAYDLLVGYRNRPERLPRELTPGSPRAEAYLANRRAARTRSVAASLERVAEQAEEAGEQLQTQRFDIEAEEVYRPYVRSEPVHRILLAAFLARRGKIDAAIDELELCESDTDAASLAQAANLTLKHPKTTAEQIKRLEKTVLAALKRSPSSTQVLLLLAELRSSQEEYDESEAHYRKVLEVAPEHWVAMNNLAVLLALQKKKPENHEEALKLINAAIEIAGPVGSMLDSRATVHMALGRPDRALADLETAIIEDDTPVRLFHQAKAYLQHKQQTRAATASLKKALANGLTANLLEPIERRQYHSLLKELNLKQPKT